MGLLFSRDAPPPQRVRDVWLSVVGFQLACFKKSWASICLCLCLCLDRGDARKHSEAWDASLTDDIRPELSVSPEGYGVRIKADSWSRLPAEAGPAGNQLQFSRAGAGSVAKAWPGATP